MKSEETTEFGRQRLSMVSRQLEPRGIRDARVLDAMRAVPREVFLSPEQRLHAYDDGPLPIGHRQTMSQPLVVALMAQALALQGDETILEVGTGSGYAAAVLAHLAAVVHTVERLEPLARRSRRTLEKLGIHHVHVHEGDGGLGWPGNAPYAGIVVSAGAPTPPTPLLEQLRPGGRMVVPVGATDRQMLVRITRLPGDGFRQDSLGPVRFVPLRGAHGWKPS